MKLPKSLIAAVIVLDVLALALLALIGYVGENIQIQRAQAFGAIALNQDLRITGTDIDNEAVTNETWNQPMQMHVSTVYVLGDTVHLYGWIIIKPSLPDCVMVGSSELNGSAVQVTWKCAGKYFWPKTYVNLAPALDGFAGTKVVLHPITITYP